MEQQGPKPLLQGTLAVVPKRKQAAVNFLYSSIITQSDWEF